MFKISIILVLPSNITGLRYTPLWMGYSFVQHALLLTNAYLQHSYMCIANSEVSKKYDFINGPKIIPKEYRVLYHILCKPREATCLMKSFLAMGLVNESAIISHVGIYSKITSPRPNRSLTKWYLFSMFLVLPWYFRSLE